MEEKNYASGPVNRGGKGNSPSLASLKVEQLEDKPFYCRFVCSPITQYHCYGNHLASILCQVFQTPWSPYSIRGKLWVLSRNGLQRWVRQPHSCILSLPWSCYKFYYTPEGICVVLTLCMSEHGSWTQKTTSRTSNIESEKCPQSHRQK